MSRWFRESTLHQPWSRLSNSLAYISLYFRILIRIERNKELYTFSLKLEWQKLTTRSVKQMLSEAEQIEGLKNHRDKKCSIWCFDRCFDRCFWRLEERNDVNCCIGTLYGILIEEWTTRERLSASTSRRVYIVADILLLILPTRPPSYAWEMLNHARRNYMLF